MQPEAGALRYSLRFLSGKSQGSEYVLDDPMAVTVGRSGEVDLILVEGMVSRRHARFTLSGDQLRVEDLGSTNGTFVNGEKVSRAQLAEGDRVLIGTSILKVMFSRSPVGTKPPPPDRSTLNEEMTSSRYRASGDLQEISVPELLEMFSATGRQAVLELRGPGGIAQVTVSDGRVEDCVLDTLPKAPADKVMLRVLGFSKGSFAVRSYREPGGRRINRPVLELLVDGLFKLDELEVLRQRLPDHGVRLVLARPLTVPLSALDEADLDILQLAHNLGDTDAALDRSDETDLEAATRLLALCDAGYLRRS